MASRIEFSTSPPTGFPTHVVGFLFINLASMKSIHLVPTAGFHPVQFTQCITTLRDGKEAVIAYADPKEGGKSYVAKISLSNHAIIHEESTAQRVISKAIAADVNLRDIESQVTVHGLGSREGQFWP